MVALTQLEDSNNSSWQEPPSSGWSENEATGGKCDE